MTLTVKHSITGAALTPASRATHSTSGVRCSPIRPRALRDRAVACDARCSSPRVCLLAARLRRADAAPRPPDPAREKRLEWFREAKYGLFIHWGLYAIPAGEWKGKRSLGLGEWIMNRSQDPGRANTSSSRTQFNPVKFNADDWVQLAQDAGMKYIVITSKHHDGFAMFKSKASPYNIVDATPFKRDVLKELADACAQARHAARLLLLAVAGLARAGRRRQHLGLRARPDPTEGAEGLRRSTCAARRSRRCKELLTGYGPVALIWFDTPRMMTPRARPALRRHRPHAAAQHADRRPARHRRATTDRTGDNVIPPEASDEAWETPATINDTWGFRKDDTDWKSPGQITFKLVDIVSKGGNYLLNVGPTARRRDPAGQPGHPAHRRPLARR